MCCCLGLKELTLSANPGITPKGWSRLAIAVAHSSQVRVLNLDYNPLGELKITPFNVHCCSVQKKPQIIGCHSNKEGRVKENPPGVL